MPAFGILGAQWGDEGKGKIVDFLAEQATMVVRFSGGNNAGHTVINNKGEFKLHLVPSGVFWQHVTPVIAAGVVVDLAQLIEEIDALEERGVDTQRLVLSDHAHVVMPYHVQLDHLEEQARGNNAIGTTGRGIGPAYVDKAARVGIRTGDLLDEAYFAQRLEPVVAQKNALLTKVYGAEPIDEAAIYKQALEYGARLRRYVGSAEQVVGQALRHGERVVLEGAQGAMLDLDHGTYPYVTSSSPMIGGALTGAGVGPHQIAGAVGVFKAYSTRVGGGPMVTELDDEVGNEIRERAWEYGTTTGRPRRVGWFDGVAARYSAQVNGFTSCVLTRLDVLDGISPVRLCVAYELDGKRLEDFPSVLSVLERCEPVWEDLPGWTNPTAGATRFAQLPEEAKGFILRLQQVIGTPIDMISTGPKREETIVVRQIVS
ncbi:MAG: adenylosuccinate synthase [Dehalococcoidia bacterium]|nr:adenylosuccinate synthase [Dehalococcoidia bacterium]